MPYVKLSFRVHKSEIVRVSGLLRRFSSTMMDEGTAWSMRGEHRKLVHEVIDSLA